MKGVIKLTDGGVDKAFEAIGNPKTSDQIIQATRPGWHEQRSSAVWATGLSRSAAARFVTSEITITGVSSRQANDVEEVFRWRRSAGSS